MCVCLVTYPGQALLVANIIYQYIIFATRPLPQIVSSVVIWKWAPQFIYSAIEKQGLRKQHFYQWKQVLFLSYCWAQNSHQSRHNSSEFGIIVNYVNNNLTQLDAIVYRNQTHWTTINYDLRLIPTRKIFSEEFYIGAPVVGIFFRSTYCLIYCFRNR